MIDQGTIDLYELITGEKWDDGGDVKSTEEILKAPGMKEFLEKFGMLENVLEEEKDK